MLLYLTFHTPFMYASCVVANLDRGASGRQGMSVQTENIETSRLDSENESEYRKRYKLMTELGPEIVYALMKDRTAEDLVVNPDGRVWIMRQGKPFEVLTEISPLRAVGATMSIAEGFGLVATHNSPVVKQRASHVGHGRGKGR